MKNNVDLQTILQKNRIKRVEGLILKVCSGPEFRYVKYKDDIWVRKDGFADFVELANAAVQALGLPPIEYPDWLIDE